jgi:signal transduction histidine kinase
VPGNPRRALCSAIVTPYSFCVVTSAATPGEAEFTQARSSQQAAYLRTRLLGAAALVFVVVAAFASHPGPGARGKSLGVATALIVFSAATVGVIRLSQAQPAVQLVLLVIAVLSGAMLVGLQPNGPGFLAVFVAVAAAALRLPVRLSAVVVAIAVAAVAVAGSWGGHWPLTGIVLDEFGVAAFYLVAIFARQLRESNERAERLLTELEATRAAQAEGAALGERQRLAREMHDVLAHSLSGLVLNLEEARLLAEQDGVDPEVTAAIERSRRLAKTGLREARSAIGMLRGEALPGPERLQGLASEFETDSGVACNLSVSGHERDLGSQTRLTLYRVAQEALTNIRKHARPERVELQLAYEESGIRLTIEDFDVLDERPPPVDGSGYGLTGMRERAELIAGSLVAGPTAAGFRVELWVPA